MTIETKEILTFNAHEKEILDNAYRIACELIEKVNDKNLYDIAMRIADALAELKQFDTFNMLEREKKE